MTYMWLRMEDIPRTTPPSDMVEHTAPSCLQGRVGENISYSQPRQRHMASLGLKMRDSSCRDPLDWCPQAEQEENLSFSAQPKLRLLQAENGRFSVPPKLHANTASSGLRIGDVLPHPGFKFDGTV